MRTRDEIQNDGKNAVNTLSNVAAMQTAVLALTLEVLLDMRDLLSSRKRKIVTEAEMTDREKALLDSLEQHGE